eukprot:CAMPEP_0172726060 /NCGR_PEP_ID=MMETSP1074-20121228/89853_1 /TAXON_ID=2916 /ORGANISM="Ceratium fusus, Strain PA161109" /LENGTH=140 /DNA_ID=CAMNT_0013552969 /DNA_START=48 /DNA_END=470 /DNA_ORIENTATION=+
MGSGSSTRFAVFLIVAQAARSISAAAVLRSHLGKEGYHDGVTDTFAAEEPAGMLPPGRDACVAFVAQRLDHGRSALDLVRDFAASCKPALESGVAMGPFRRACGEVQRVALAAVSNSGQKLDVKSLCNDVMRTFQALGPQ